MGCGSALALFSLQDPSIPHYGSSPGLLASLRRQELRRVTEQPMLEGPLPSGPQVPTSPRLGTQGTPLACFRSVRIRREYVCAAVVSNDIEVSFGMKRIT